MALVQPPSRSAGEGSLPPRAQEAEPSESGSSRPPPPAVQPHVSSPPECLVVAVHRIQGRSNVRRYGHADNDERSSPMHLRTSLGDDGTGCRYIRRYRAMRFPSMSTCSGIFLDESMSSIQPARRSPLESFARQRRLPASKALCYSDVTPYASLACLSVESRGTHTQRTAKEIAWSRRPP